MNKVQFVRDSKQLYYELLESYHDTKPKLTKHKQEKNRQTNKKVSSSKTDYAFSVQQKNKKYHSQKHREHLQQLDSNPSLDEFWQRKNRQLFYQLLGDKCQCTDRAKQKSDSRQDRKKIQAKTQRNDCKTIKARSDNLETNSEYLPFKGYTYRNDAYKNSKTTLSTKPSTLQKASFKSSQQALNPKASAKPKRQQFFPKNLPQRQQKGYQSEDDMCESQVEQVVVDQSQANSTNYKYNTYDNFQEDMLSNNKSRYYHNGKYEKHDDRGFKKRPFDQQQFLSPVQQPCNQPPIFQSSSSSPTLLQPSTQHLDQASNFKNTNKKQLSIISSKSKQLNDQSVSLIQSKQSGSSAIDSKSFSSAFNFNIDQSKEQLPQKKISAKQQKSVTSDKKEENNEYSYIFKLSEVMDRHNVCEDNGNKKDVNQGAGKHRNQGNADVQKIKGSAVNSNQQKNKNLKQIGSGQLIESDHNQTQNNSIQNELDDVELQPIKLQKIQSKSDILRNSIMKYNQLQKRKQQLLQMKPKLSIHQNTNKNNQNDILLAKNPKATPQHKNNSQHSSIDYHQFDQIFTSSHVQNNCIAQSIGQGKRNKENTGKNILKKKEDPYKKKTQSYAKSNSYLKSESQQQSGTLHDQESIIQKSRHKLQNSQSSSMKKEDASILIPSVQNDSYHVNSEQQSSVHQDNTLKSIDNQQQCLTHSSKKSRSSSRPEQVQPSVRTVKSNQSHSALQNIEYRSHKASQSINSMSHQEIPQQPEFIGQYNQSIDFINPIFTKNISQSQKSNPHETSLSHKSQQSDHSNNSINFSQLSSFHQEQYPMPQHSQPYCFSQFKTEWKYMNQKDKWMQQIRSHNQQQSNNFTVIKIDRQEQQSGQHIDSKVDKQQNARLPSLQNITMRKKYKTSNSIDLDQSASTFLNFLKSTSNQQLPGPQESSSQLFLKKISSQSKVQTENQQKDSEPMTENKESSNKLSNAINVPQSIQWLSEQEKNRKMSTQDKPKTANVKLVQVVSQSESQPLESSKTLQLVDENQQSHSPLYELLQEMDQELKHIQEMQRIENRYVSSSSQDEEEDKPRQQGKKKNSSHTKEPIPKKKVKLIDSEDMDSFLVKKKHELSKIMEVPEQSKVYDEHNSLKQSLNSNHGIVSKEQKHNDTSQIVNDSSLSRNRIKKLSDDQIHQTLNQDHSDINNESFGQLTIIQKKPSQDVHLGQNSNGYDHEEHSEIDLNQLLERIQKINSETDDGHNLKQHATNNNSSSMKPKPQPHLKNPSPMNPNPQPSQNPAQLPVLNKSQSKSSHTSQQSSTDLRKYRQSLNQIKSHVDKSYNKFSSIMNISKEELKRIAPDQDKGISNQPNSRKTHSYQSDSQPQTLNNSSFSFPEHQPSYTSTTNPKQTPAIVHTQQSNIFQIKPIQTSFKSVNSIDQSFVENYLPENIKRKSSTKKVSISKIPQKIPQKASPFFDMSSNSINISKDSNSKSYDKKSRKMHSRTQSNQHDHSIAKLSSKEIMEMFGQFSQGENPQSTNPFKTQSFIKTNNSDSQEINKTSFKRTESKK